MNIPSVKLFHSIFQLGKQMGNLSNHGIHLESELVYPEGGISELYKSDLDFSLPSALSKNSC